jgi:S-adenosylmethionine synthetase
MAVALSSSVELILSEAPHEGSVEVVERKGLGHPDTICDALSERISRSLCRHYLDRFGRILHHNVDKLLLVAGASEPAFGGGRIVSPVELHLGGRAVRQVRNEKVPVDELAIDACRSWFAEVLPELSPHVRIQSHLRPGSADLVDVFGRASSEVPLSNDTSIGTGYAPLSPLEQTILDLEPHLTSIEFRAAHPHVGTDVKVMGVRRGDRSDLTLAVAFVDRFVSDLDDYRRKKALLRERIAARASGRMEVSVALNAADDLERGAAYLTVTGTSAEAGDDGETGRGNRVNGLITPYRPMTMEAVAGKNPTNHVGKLYNVAASRLAGAIVEIHGVKRAECCLVSSIGAPIDRPQLVHLRVLAEDRPLESLRAPLLELVHAHLFDLRTTWRAVVRGELSLF